MRYKVLVHEVRDIGLVVQGTGSWDTRYWFGCLFIMEPVSTVRSPARSPKTRLEICFLPLSERSTTSGHIGEPLASPS